MSYEIKEFFREFVPFFGFMMLLCGLIAIPAVGLGFWLESATCAAKATALGLEHTWGPLQGCVVVYNGVPTSIGQIWNGSIKQLP